MAEWLDKLIYSTDAGTADFTENGTPTVPEFAETIEDILDSLNGGGSTPRAVYEDFLEIRPQRPIRCDLMAALVGAAGVVAYEYGYLISPSELDDVAGFACDYAYTATWTASGNSIDSAVGGRTGHKTPITCSVSASGLLLAKTGREVIAPAAAAPALLCISDISAVHGLLRVFEVDTATGVSPLIRKWR